MSYIGTNKIGKMYLGSTAMSKAYLGGNLVYQQGSSPYIRGGADGSYIDTGIVPDETTRIEIVARNFNPSTNHTNWLFGSRIANKNNAYGIVLNTGVGFGRMSPAYGNADLTWADSWGLLSNFHKYELSDQGLYVDDTRYFTVTASIISSGYSIHLFGVNDGGNHYDVSLPIDIFSVKIYKGGNLVRNFTPRNSPSACFYDSVSGTLFTNAGAGSLSYGTFDTDSYMPLEYIGCTNAQYMDMGIYGKNDMDIAVRFMTKGTSVNNPAIFGTMGGSDGTYLAFQLGNSSAKNRYANFYIYSSTNNQIYNNNSTKLTDQLVTLVKDGTSVQLTKNGATFGTKVTLSVPTFTTPDTMLLGTLRYNGSPSEAQSNLFNGNIYYASFGTERNYVPAKVNNVAGFYDTYHDVFYPSVTNTPFVSGTEL